MNLRAYPLCWPDGWKRTPSFRRKTGRFFTNNREPSVSDGVGRIMASLSKMGIKRDDMIISTNVETRLDGLPRSDRSNPSDPGAAVYWRKSSGAAMKCMAIDCYKAVADNLCAIAATLEAMRAIERHGGAEILDRAFQGFAALAASTSDKPHWRDVLGIDGSSVTRDVINSRYRSLASVRHPDAGGSDALMSELNIARDEALREVSA